MDKLKTVFLGTPEFSVSSLKVLNEHPLIDLSLVISMPDRPAGRGKKLTPPPVALFAKEHNLSLLQTSNINKEDEFLSLQDIDLIIVIAFAQFLGDSILKLPKLGCFNIHTSLLPKYRGAAPIQYALLNGDTITGVSIQRMVKKMDAGDIAYLKEVNIDPSETSESLFKKLENESANSLNDFISMLAQNNITYQQQDENQVTFAPTIKKADGIIDFLNETASEIKNKFRAFYPWPGVNFKLNGLRVKVLDLEISNEKIEPGKLGKFGHLVIGCKENSIHFKRVQLEGKKPCNDTDLLNGLKNKFDTFEVTHD